MASIHSPTEQTAPARWRPCDRACHATLRWPVRTAHEHSHDGRPTHELPELPAPSHSLLALSAEAGLRRLVHRHMTRLKLTPLLTHTNDCFDCVVERYGDFVIESCGGPLYYSERHARLAAGAGWPVLLDESGRDIWLVQLWHSMEDIGWSAHLRAAFWRWAEPLSVHLLAPRARHSGLRRYPYLTVCRWLNNGATPSPKPQP